MYLNKEKFILKSLLIKFRTKAAMPKMAFDKKETVFERILFSEQDTPHTSARFQHNESTATSSLSERKTYDPYF